MLQNILGSGACAFLVSAVCVPCLFYFSHFFKVYDRIDARKIHSGNVSRLGGIGIFAGFFSIAWIMVFSGDVTAFNKYFYLAGLLCAFLIGLVDDIWHLRARYKLILQCITGLLVAGSGLQVTVLGWLPADSVIAWTITVLWVVTFMNAVNLTDGLDGLASGIIIIASLFLCAIAFFFNNTIVMQLSIILCGATLGFYVYNFPYGRIFMGDSGAYLLGFIYATLPLMGITKTPAVTVLMIPIVMLLFPLWDIAKVILHRIKKGSHIFTADRSHLHYRLLEIGFSKKKVLLVLYSYTIILGICSALMAHIEPMYAFLLSAAIFMLVALSFYVIDTIETIIKIIPQKQHHPRKRYRKKPAHQPFKVLPGIEPDAGAGGQKPN